MFSKGLQFQLHDFLEHLMICSNNFSGVVLNKAFVLVPPY
jgi:hypothetical protein